MFNLKKKSLFLLAILFGLTAFFIIVGFAYWNLTVVDGFSSVKLGYVSVSICIVNTLLIYSIVKKYKGAPLLTVLWLASMLLLLVIYYFIRDDYLHALLCVILLAILIGNYEYDKK